MTLRVALTVELPKGPDRVFPQPINRARFIPMGYGLYIFQTCIHCTRPQMYNRNEKVIRSGLTHHLRGIYHSGQMPTDFHLSYESFDAAKLREITLFYPMELHHEWEAGLVHKVWHRQYKGIFLDHDFEIAKHKIASDTTGSYPFAEWYSAIHFWQRGYDVLIEKYLFNINHHASSAHALLQAADYCAWAIYRRWHLQDRRANKWSRA